LHIRQAVATFSTTFGINERMAVLSEFRPRRPDVSPLARVVDAEASRLCAVIETSADFQTRQQALAELKLLAHNLRVCMEVMGCGVPEFSESAARRELAA
jgi:hypothetical protein